MYKDIRYSFISYLILSQSTATVNLEFSQYYAFMNYIKPLSLSIDLQYFMCELQKHIRFCVPFFAIKA